ncbi:MAG: YjcQ family protein [Oscillospiraceae bacterium]|nr:YjcQ family protein [Oscillospiraceae bacterium]
MKEINDFEIIYDVLKRIHDFIDEEEFDTEQISYETLEISKARWNNYIEALVDEGYIKGVIIEKQLDGDKIIDVSEIKLTLKGLKYLDENSIEQES